MRNLRKRKYINYIALGFTGLSAIIGIFWLVFILSTVISKGIASINFELILEDPVPPGVEGGGLKNAFIGQLMLTAFSVFIGVSIGILGGTFLAEYGRKLKITKLISSVSDIMVSMLQIMLVVSPQRLLFVC